MALTNLQVFTQNAQDSFTETLRQQVDLFNAATNGGLVLRSGTMTGDFADTAFWEKLTGLVRRRDAYATGAVTPIALSQLLDTAVRVDAGTPPIQIDPHWFQRINANPGVEGVVIGRQLAVETLADMVNVGIGCVVASVGQVAGFTNDITGDATPTLNPRALNRSVAKFGDRSSDVRVHIMHSVPMHDLFGDALANAERLFTYDTVNVIQDPFGRRYVMTDSPSLVVSGTPDTYYTASLVSQALMIQRNNDYLDNTDITNGDESIRRTFQAQWSFEIGVKGFAWDKAGGGKSPNNAELATAANWDRHATDDKDLPGVLTLSN